VRDHRAAHRRRASDDGREDEPEPESDLQKRLVGRMRRAPRRQDGSPTSPG
jgi:hypothetical protein